MGLQFQYQTLRIFEALFHAAGFLWRFEAKKNGVAPEQLEQELVELRKKFTDILESAPAVSGRAYEISEKNLREGKKEVLRLPQDITQTDK